MLLVKSRGEEVLVRRGKNGQRAAAGARGYSAVANRFGLSLRVQAVGRPGLEAAGRVVISHLRLHVAARPPVRVHRHAQPGIVVISHVLLGRGNPCLLLNEPSARIKDVGDPAGENPHAEAVERNLHTVAGRAGARGGRPEDGFEAAGSLRMAGRKIEESIPAAATLSGRAAVNRTRPFHHVLAVHTNGCDQRFGGIQ